MTIIRWRPRLPSCGKESGQSLVLFAAGLVVFLGFVGMSIDVGRIVYTKTALQRSADAAALAGSQVLPASQSDALAVANVYVTKNGGADCQPSCGSVNETGDQITVTTTRNIDHFFLKFVGVADSDVEASARVGVQTVTGLSFGNPSVFPFTIWGGNPNYPNCNATYGLCVGATKTYRSNQWDNQVSPSVRGDDEPWSVPGNNFKGYFNYASGDTYYQADPYQEYSFGGNATSVSGEMTEKLHEHYVTGRPVVIPVIVTGSCTSSCGNLHFTIVAWVALELINDPDTNAGQDWKGKIVASYQVPGGISGGYVVPGSSTTLTTATMLE